MIELKLGIDRWRCDDGGNVGMHGSIGVPPERGAGGEVGTGQVREISGSKGNVGELEPNRACVRHVLKREAAIANVDFADDTAGCIGAGEKLSEQVGHRLKHQEDAAGNIRAGGLGEVDDIDLCIRCSADSKLPPITEIDLISPLRATASALRPLTLNSANSATLVLLPFSASLNERSRANAFVQWPCWLKCPKRHRKPPAYRRCHRECRT